MGPELEEGALTEWPQGGLRVASLEKKATHTYIYIYIYTASHAKFNSMETFSENIAV